MSNPTFSPTHLLTSVVGINPQQREEEFDAIEYQIQLLREQANAENPNLKQLQQLYCSTIMICNNASKFGSSTQILLEAEEKKVFSNDPETRAQLFSKVILQTLEKGNHETAHELYNLSCTFKVWDNYFAIQTTVKEKLSNAGFKL